MARRRTLACWLLLLALLFAGGAAAAELAFDLKVEHGQVIETMRIIRIKEGDVVTLRLTTDQPLVVHLHGYDIEKRLAVGRVTELAFTAFATGRFPLHIHAPGGSAAAHGHEDLPLVTVEVYPR